MEEIAMRDGKRALWTKLVADFELSGLSQRAFAEQKQIGLSNLRYWMYKLRNESRPLAAEERWRQSPLLSTLSAAPPRRRHACCRSCGSLARAEGA
jgi:hypothetical protein